MGLSGGSEPMSIRSHHRAVAAARRWLRSLLARCAREPREEPAVPHAPDDILARLGLHERLLEALLAIPEPYRSALFHCGFEGMDRDELARRLRIPPETVEWRLQRALSMLAERTGRG
jgi:RNA polymerase sigma factor (sigma-70 family)